MNRENLIMWNKKYLKIFLPGSPFFSQTPAVGFRIMHYLPFLQQEQELQVKITDLKYMQLYQTNLQHSALCHIHAKTRVNL